MITLIISTSILVNILFYVAVCFWEKEDEF